MNMSVKALTAPVEHTLDDWLNEPRTALCGNTFTPSDPMWRPDPTSESVNWEAALGCVDEDMQPWLHAALALQMGRLAQRSMANFAYSLRRFANEKIDILDADNIFKLRELQSYAGFSDLVAFIRFWANQDVEKKPSEELVKAYADTPRKKRVRNDVILSLDPNKGPLTKTESIALFQWCHEKFKAGELKPEHFLYLLLALSHGARGVQQRMWVFDDFFEDHGKPKVRIFYAKQKGGHWREDSEVFDLRSDHYKLIQTYRATTLARLKETYPDSANWDKAIGNVPLFRKVSEHENGNHRNPPVLVPSDEHHLLEKGTEAYFHIGSSSIKRWLDRIQETDGFPVSHRTKKPIKITNAHRFRHTFGTDLSNEGYAEWAIAKALLHTDARSSAKYREVSAELLKLCDEKMTNHLAVAVNAFTGRIVTSRDEAENGDNADRQIEDLAVCGSNQICHLDAPYSCYACPKFQPLLDADHSAALEHLEANRAETMEADKTVGLTWDRAILACRKVILDCEKMKASKPSLESNL